MTTTAEEKKWTYHKPSLVNLVSIIRPDGTIFIPCILSAEEASEICDKFNALEKLSEASAGVSDEEIGLEVTDEMIGKWVQHYVDLINNTDGTTNFDCTQALRWFKDAKYNPAIHKLSRTIATQQAEIAAMKERIQKLERNESIVNLQLKAFESTVDENTELHSTIAQLQAELKEEKDKVDLYIQASDRWNIERAQLQAEKERIAKALTELPDETTTLRCKYKGQVYLLKLCTETGAVDEGKFAEWTHKNGWKYDEYEKMWFWTPKKGICKGQVRDFKFTNQLIEIFKAEST